MCVCVCGHTISNKMDMRYPIRIMRYIYINVEIVANIDLRRNVCVCVCVCVCACVCVSMRPINVEIVVKNDFCHNSQLPSTGFIRQKESVCVCVCVNV